MATLTNTPAPPQLPCEHKRNVGCVLTALPVCCACADKRPMAPAYPVYIDGEGMKTQGKRWARYCWRCRDYYNISDITSPNPGYIDSITISTDMASRQIPGLYETTPTQQIPPYSQRTVPNPFDNDLGSLHSHPPRPTHPQRAARPQVNPFGTREDVENETYESPLSLMFQRFAPRANASARTVPTTIPILPTVANIELSDEEEDGHGENAIDRQIDRPEPLKAEDMKISIACRMCLEQRIDTLIELCMHLAMCRWCSDVWQVNSRMIRQQDPSAHSPWKCPVCRKKIMNIRRVYF